MDSSRPTLSELELRWEKTLAATQAAAIHHLPTYRELKNLAIEIVSTPIDINDYFPTVEKLMGLLEMLDPCGPESIFHIFKTRISPSSIWDVKMLRMECRDLLDHLASFDEWRREKRHLRQVK
jgi:hypothetical protein